MATALRRSAVALATLVALLLAACGPVGGSGGSAPGASTATATPSFTAVREAYTPQQLRDAYGVTPLLAAGDTGQGQTVVLIESYGSPTLQQDVAAFDARFSLPPVSLQVIAPLGTAPYNPTNADMAGWAGETTEDVDLVHALAPGAGIVVLTSPVDETEGTIGLPQFLRLEQYAVARHLGSIISQSWDVSEYTLRDSAGQAQIQQFTSFYQQATTQDGITFLAGTGDWGASDYANLQGTQLVNAPTSGFPSDEPWVTGVGGTSLYPNSARGYSEVAWPESGGGVSAFFTEPSFQRALPSAAQAILSGHRGRPDVAADADPTTGMLMDVGGQWGLTSGTSAGGPTWAAIIALADQMAGHPLGFINPTLYAIGTSARAARDFRDITAGNNDVNQSGALVRGYAAAPGWDPVTGFGSPIARSLVPDLIAASQ